MMRIDDGRPPRQMKLHWQCSRCQAEGSFNENPIIAETVDSFNTRMLERAYSDHAEGQSYPACGIGWTSLMVVTFAELD